MGSTPDYQTRSRSLSFVQHSPPIHHLMASLIPCLDTPDTLAYVMCSIPRHSDSAPSRKVLEEESEGWQRLRTAIDLILEDELSR